MHPHEGIFSAFVEGQASASERQEVEAHLKGCRDCRELLSFMRDFSDIAKDVADGEIAQDEPHPQNSVIIAYEEAGSIRRRLCISVATCSSATDAPKATISSNACVHQAGLRWSLASSRERKILCLKRLKSPAWANLCRSLRRCRACRATRARRASRR